MAMNRCLLFVLLLAALIVSVLGFFWVGNPSYNQSLLASTAKALDYAEGWKSVGGPPWWTPNFLHGSSLAPSLTSLLTSLWVLLWTHIAGMFAGPKIAALLCLFAASLATYALGWRLTGDAWAAAACAAAFLFTPPVYFRLVHVEHMVSVAAFVVIPLVLLRLAVFVEKPSRLNALIFGASFALLLLTYAEAAALLLPLAFACALTLWLWKQRTWRAPGSALLVALLTVVILGVLPVLPAWRELQLATVFELAPFEGWQNAFSLKSTLPWFDRTGFLSQGTLPGFAPTSARGGNYLGLIPALLVGAVFICRPEALYATRTGFLCRLFVALTLLASWLSFGPHSVLTGQFAFLSMASGAADPVIALSWFLLVIQAWVILRLLPLSMPGRHLVGAAMIAVYLLVPGFRLISWLPVYSDLRAPHDFSQIVGLFFWVLAAGCAFRLALDMLPRRLPRLAVALALLLLAALDVSPYFRPFFRGPIDQAAFQDFQDATQFLSESPKPGWVHPLSGRYFYLLTPYFSKRGLTSEAFNSYLMQRGMSYLQVSAQSSPALLRSFLNIGGVTYVLIDRKDPDTPEALQDRYKTLLSTAFENEHFLILENPQSLAPAFLSRRFISGEANPGQMAVSGLTLENTGMIVLPDAVETYPAQPGKAGQLKEDGPVLDEKFSQAKPSPFLPLALIAPRWKNYHQINMAPASQPGWAVVPEAYHPDWTASSDGKSLSVLPADGALLAVQVKDPGQPITLNFSPPWWYNGFFLASAIGWVGCGMLLAAGFLPIPAPAKLKSWLGKTPGFQQVPAIALSDFARENIRRPLVVIPTYNEARSLPGLLDRLLAGNERLEVLIVDDNSPDGTGDLVKNHPEFDRRLHLLARTGKLGLGSAYREGFQWAFERNFDACLEMDADLSHDPADIPRLLETLESGADAAIGSRYLGGVRVMNWPERRLFLSTGASRFVRLVTGLPLTDATSGFKALRVTVLQRLDWSQFRAEGYGFQVELHHALWQAGARMVEVPIVFTERRDGETKMSIGIAIEAAWRTIRLSLGNK